MIELASNDQRFTLAQPCVPSPVSIGRDPGMQWVIAHWRVARRHAVLLERSRTLWIQDLGTWSGTWVNRKRIVADTPLLEGDEVVIGPLTFRARWVPDASGLGEGDRAQHADDGTADVLRWPDAALDGETQKALAGSPSDARNVCAEQEQDDWYAVPSGDSSNGFERSLLGHSEVVCDAAEATYIPTHPLASHDALDNTDREAVAIRQRMQLRLLSAMDLRREDVSMMSDQHLRVRARAILDSLIEREPALCPPERRESYITAVIDEAVGLGPLEPLLADDAISEIMVNRHDEIYVERAGRLERVNIAFANEASVLAVLERIVAPLGRRIDEGAPMVDARLADGSRVNGVIAPIALKGPTLTIRKFSRRRLVLADLVGSGAMSANMAAFLTLCVVHKKNIVVSGGTGSGKTTLLNILSGLIGKHERIITIEDAAELQLPHAHVVSLEARPANIEGRGSVDIRDLVRNALRMRPDRIVVGECRGAEAFDMLAAMNTGHEGSLTTLHANTPRDALARLETMILMTGMPLPLAAVREHISAGIDIVIQQARLEDGRRVLTDVAEVSGMDSGGIQLQSLFLRNKGRGHFEGAGVLPSFVDAWRERGIVMPAEWFDRAHLPATRP